MTWQPISTAPNDGTWILLGDFQQANPEEHNQGVAHWFNGYWSDGFPNHSFQWRGAFAPTHWQPLPEPPERDKP